MGKYMHAPGVSPRGTLSVTTPMTEPTDRIFATIKGPRSHTGPAAVTYSANGTNAARNATATFRATGSYQFTVAVTDGTGHTASSTVAVSVVATTTSMDVMSSGTSFLNPGQTKTYTGQFYDQFGTVVSAPGAVTWSMASGGGSIAATGVYTAALPTGMALVRGTCGSLTNTAQVLVNAAPTVGSAVSTATTTIAAKTAAFDVQGADDQSVDLLNYTWSATGSAAVSFSPANSLDAEHTVATFAAPGSYVITARIADKQSLFTTSTLTVAVVPAPAALTVLPASASVPAAGTVTCGVSGFDQFGQSFTGPVVWSSSGGSIASNGTLTAPTTAGAVIVTATAANGVSGTATIQVTAPSDPADLQPPSPPQVTLIITGGTTGDGHGTFNGEEVSFTNLQQVTVTVAAITTGGVIGDVTVTTSEGWSRSGPAGAVTVPLTNEGLVTIDASATATRNGQSASASAEVKALVDRTAPALSLYRAAPYLRATEAGTRPPLRHSTTADADLLFLNGEAASRNLDLQTSRGMNVFSLAGFTVNAEVSDAAGLSGANQPTAAVTGGAQRALPVQVIAATTADPDLVTISGFTGLPESVTYNPATLQIGTNTGAYMVHAHLQDRCGNEADLDLMRCWVDTQPPVARIAVIPAQSGPTMPRPEIAADGATEFVRAWFILATPDTAEIWQTGTGGGLLSKLLATPEGVPGAGDSAAQVRSLWRLNTGILASNLSPSMLPYFSQTVVSSSTTASLSLKVSPGVLPDHLSVNTFGGSYYEPGDYPRGQEAVRSGRTYTWEWNDHYFTSIKDTISLTFDDPVLLPSLDPANGIGYVMATLTSEIHGIINPFTFPLAFIKKTNGQYTIYSAIATSDGIPAPGNLYDYPLSQATGPSLKGLAEFGDAWHSLLKHNSSKVTHAYWDSYMTKYRGLTGNPRITDTVPPDMKKRLKSSGTVYFERTYPGPKATASP